MTDKNKATLYEVIIGHRYDNMTYSKLLLSYQDLANIPDELLKVFVGEKIEEPYFIAKVNKPQIITSVWDEEEAAEIYEVVKLLTNQLC